MRDDSVLFVLSGAFMLIHSLGTKLGEEEKEILPIISLLSMPINLPHPIMLKSKILGNIKYINYIIPTKKKSYNDLEPDISSTWLCSTLKVPASCN